MKVIYINEVAIKAREEEFGYTIFDGNVAIQVNDTFFEILKDISNHKSDNEIIEHLITEYNITPDMNEKIQNDIQYVKDFVKRMGWEK